MSQPVSTAPSRTNQVDLGAIIAITALVYAVFVFDLVSREIHPFARLVNAAVGAGVVLLYITRAPRQADRLDRLLLLAFLVFAATCVLSAFPRQSLDAVLGALLAVSALFVARGIFARRTARRLFEVAMIVLSALFTIVTAVQWIPAFVEWWSLTSWEVLPPLDLRLTVEPWGYRHDVILLLVLLYPAWWIGQVGRLRAAIAVLVGAITIALLLIDGSRTIWMASLVGAAAIGLRNAQLARLALARPVLVTAGLLAAVILLIVVTGAGAALGERLIRVAPIEQRGAMWTALIQAWVDAPITGHGPGSFAWLLQGTGYFDTNSLAARHADSAPLQLLSEGGIVGTIAAGVVLMAIVPAVYEGRSRAAVFAVFAALAASIALNPTALVFLVGVTIGWIGYASPREEPVGETRSPGSRGWIGPVTAGATAIIGIAYAATVGADLAYAVARSSVDRGELANAAGELRIASSLDPSLAVYHRQLGALLLVDGRPEEAIETLDRATRFNANDDLAWRTLGVAHAALGDAERAVQALQRAVALQRSDPTNLLLVAEALRQAGDADGASRALAEAVQAWPMLVAAPGWDLMAERSETPVLVESALSRWRNGQPSPEPVVTQPLLLGIITGADAAALDSDLGRVSPTLRPGFIAVSSCSPYADAALDESLDSDRRTSTYWALATRLGELRAADTDDFRRLHWIMTGDPVLSLRTGDRLHPLHENGARLTSADTWGYRRLPIEWPPIDGMLPSHRSGFWRWHHDPFGAARNAASTTLEDACAAALRDGG